MDCKRLALQISMHCRTFVPLAPSAPGYHNAARCDASGICGSPCLPSVSKKALLFTAPSFGPTPGQPTSKLDYFPCCSTTTVTSQSLISRAAWLKASCIQPNMANDASWCLFFLDLPNFLSYTLHNKMCKPESLCWPCHLSQHDHLDPVGQLCGFNGGH